MRGTTQIALVTGASRGIGQAIALELGRQGYYVVGTSTTSAGAAKITDELQAGGYGGRGLVMDVASSAGIEAGLADLRASDLRPGVLVNNAGVTRDNLLIRMDQWDWNTVIEVHLGALYRLARACLRDMMKARYGRIVSLTSVVGSVGNAGQCNYAAAKAGMIGFTRALAREVASRRITVNAVAPGFIDTDMTRALTEDRREALARNIPLGRFGAVDEVAAAVAFLVSPQAGYITGQTLHVNGGMYMG